MPSKPISWMRIFGAVSVVAIGAVATVSSCTDVRHGLIGLFSPTYAPAAKPPGAAKLPSSFDGADAARPRIAIELTPVAQRFIQTTDIQFVPGDPQLMIVLEKTGTAKWFDLANNTQGEFFHIKVLDASEEGLLGLAFHPKYLQNGRFYLNYVTRAHDEDVTQVAEWTVTPGSDLRHAQPRQTKLILEVVQPYQNHNAGQLMFGPDGYLYIGFGDGGWANDPHGNGQNRRALLGKMLRVDVDKSEGKKAYAVPPDNPFLGDKNTQPEIWALGLRNPWRYSFAPDGRLIAGDVGQDRFEEVDIIERGANLGWNVREAGHCFKPRTDCSTAGLTDPIHEYGREEGGSVTGGYVALSKTQPELAEKYVFADFLSGRIWALDLPKKGAGPAKVYTLGHWPIIPSTFGRDAAGALYIADYPEGVIYRLDPARTSSTGGSTHGR